MRHLKWLFQPAYLLLIIVLVALYVNRELIFPGEVAESMEAQALVDKVEGVIEDLRSSTEEEAGEGTGITTADTADGGQVEPPVEVAAVAEQLTPPAQEVTVPVPAVVEEHADTDAAMANAPVVEPPAVAFEPNVTEQAPSEAEAPTDEETEPEASNGVVVIAEPRQPAVLPEVEAAQPVEQTTSMPPLDVWRAARAAVWQGDLDSAVAGYRQLITLQPENYDAYGEIGNVLLAQSQVPEAIEAYTNAARLIRQSGHRRMAFRVAAIVAMLDTQRGRALFDELAR